MCTVYVNLHPDYDYATAIIGKGYINIKDYVKNVDWLMWNKLGKAPEIKIFGSLGDHEKAIEQHLERTYVFCQRMKEAGAEVLIRNKRSDDWSPFESKEFSHEQMVEIECQLFEKSTEEKWAIESVQRNEGLLDLAKKLNKEELIAHSQEALERSKERLSEVQQKEAERQEFIRNFWK